MLTMVGATALMDALINEWNAGVLTVWEFQSKVSMIAVPAPQSGMIDMNTGLRVP